MCKHTRLVLMTGNTEIILILKKIIKKTLRRFWSYQVQNTEIYVCCRQI